ncbi:MAG TPA: VOC family protein [Gaiellales bacterium]|jgi:methylmalonyl-CoA/ethylmalonyl-CoA epimerase|nr:VOC family protein [Gaiellales bacterium]
MGVSLDGVGQIRINVKDLARAVAFYRDVLGTEFLFDVPEQGIAFLDCGGVRLFLAAAEPGSGSTTAAVYYRVNGLDRAYEELAARGVEFTHPPTTVYTLEDVEGRMAFLEDPEGNTVALMEETPIGADGSG